MLEKAQRLLQRPIFFSLWKRRPPGKRAIIGLSAAAWRACAVSPEAIGLCGCWQVLAVRRERVPLGSNPDPPTDTIGYYATSLSQQQCGDEELLKIVRDHWAAIENGRITGATTPSTRMAAKSPNAAPFRS